MVLFPRPSNSLNPVNNYLHARSRFFCQPEARQRVLRAVWFFSWTNIRMKISSRFGYHCTLAGKRRQETKTAAICGKRKLSRCAESSSSRRKAAWRVEALQRHAKNVSWDFAHTTSHALVPNPDTLLPVFEDFGVRRMTCRARAKHNASGPHLRSGASAAPCINAALLRSDWGKVKDDLT